MGYFQKHHEGVTWLGMLARVRLRRAQTMWCTHLSHVQEVVRASDLRVSERTPLNQLRLKLSGPIYNELTGEVDPVSTLRPFFCMYNCSKKHTFLHDLN